MSYVANTASDQQAMLEAIGAKSVEELFEAIPADVRFPKMELPKPLSEMEILAEMERMADANADANHLCWFLGAGAYNHFVPSVVPQLFHDQTRGQPDIGGHVLPLVTTGARQTHQRRQIIYLCAAAVLSRPGD